MEATSYYHQTTYSEDLDLKPGIHVFQDGQVLYVTEEVTIGPPYKTIQRFVFGVDFADHGKQIGLKSLNTYQGNPST